MAIDYEPLLRAARRVHRNEIALRETWAGEYYACAACNVEFQRDPADAADPKTCPECDLATALGEPPHRWQNDLARAAICIAGPAPASVDGVRWSRAGPASRPSVGNRPPGADGRRRITGPGLSRGILPPCQP